MRDAIVPDALQVAAERTGLSPTIRAGGFLFLNGATCGGPDGTLPKAASDEARMALAKVQTIVAAAAGATEAGIVDLTRHHSDITASFADSHALVQGMFSPPLPAWTAVEVAGLPRPGARVELRAIARDLGSTGS